MKRLCLILIGLLSCISFANTPLKVPIQAVLSHESGGLINERRHVSVGIYPENSLSAVWQETFSNYLFVDGVFSVTLGETTPLSVDGLNLNNARLGFTLDGEATPFFINLSAVPYSIQAKYAETIPVASETQLGGIKVGENLTIVDGVLSATEGISNIPTASATTKGGIIVGANLSIENGVLSAPSLTVSNIGSDGIGIYAGNTSNTIQLKSFKTGSDKISLHETEELINIDIIPENIIISELSGSISESQLPNIPITKGATGLTSASFSGQLLVGKADGSFSLGTIQAGDNIIVTHSDGGNFTISASSSTNTWHNGTGSPSISLGNNGDFYLDTISTRFYIKSSGVWTEKTLLKGETGETGPKGETGPAGSNGIDGSTWWSGATVETIELMKENDFFLDTDDYKIYQYDGSNWSISVESIKGATGPSGSDGENGAKWFSGESATEIENMNTGDYFLDTDDYSIYKYNGSTWVSQITSIKGADGADGSDNAWGFSGNDISSGEFIGTTGSGDDLILKAESNQVALFEHNTSGPNITLGHSSNTILTGVVGSIISGGGYTSNENNIYDNYSVVAGGINNTAGSSGSDKASQAYATVSGGNNNIASSIYATVPGGYYNEAAGTASFAAGYNAYASGEKLFVWNGQNSENVAESASDYEVAMVATNGFKFSTYASYSTFTESKTLYWQDSKLGVGRIPATNTLKVNGNASKSTTGSWLSNSDRRLKKDIHPLNDGLSKLLQLKPVTYKWKEPEKHGNQDFVIRGFIAQEIQEVFPTWVTKGNDGYLNLQYIGFEALTVDAFKTLNNKLEKQSEEIETLIKQNEFLMAEINKLKKHIK